MLHFGAVDYRATVWVNDLEMARHEGGHSPFTADITAALTSRDNVIVVRAEDSLADKTIPRGKQYWEVEPEGIFYTATTGIWGSVWLEPLPERHVRGLRLQPDLEAGSVHVTVDGGGDPEVVVRLEGAVAGRLDGASGEVRLEHAEAWSPESPRLYDVEVTLGQDLVVSYFGLRTVEAKDGRWLLNGKPYTQRLVLDQGYFPAGLLTAPDGDALRRDVELAQEFGFNGARKHQKVEDPRWLYWADRLGFLVWCEMPSFHQHSAEAERRLTREWADVVRLHRDHPCVVTWVPANESFGLGEVEHAVRSDFLVRVHRLTHELDGSRPVVSNDGWEHALTDLCTIHDYSPPAELRTHCRSLEAALGAKAEGHEPYDPGFAYRGEPVLVTEFGGLRVAGTGGWGWLEVPDQQAFVDTYGQLIDAFVQPGPVEGFCYTQLTDVQQEQNGLLTAGREPKVDPAVLRPLTEKGKRR
jgi:hypothetical protein